MSSFKNPHIKIDLLLPRSQNPLSYYTLYNESKHTLQYPCLGSKIDKGKTSNGFLCVGQSPSLHALSEQGPTWGGAKYEINSGKLTAKGFMQHKVCAWILFLSFSCNTQWVSHRYLASIMSTHQISQGKNNMSIRKKWNAHAYIHFETQNAPWVFMLCNSLSKKYTRKIWGGLYA